MWTWFIEFFLLIFLPQDMESDWIRTSQWHGISASGAAMPLIPMTGIEEHLVPGPSKESQCVWWERKDSG